MATSLTRSRCSLLIAACVMSVWLLSACNSQRVEQVPPPVEKRPAVTATIVPSGQFQNRQSLPLPTSVSSSSASSSTKNALTSGSTSARIGQEDAVGDSLEKSIQQFGEDLDHDDALNDLDKTLR